MKNIVLILAICITMSFCFSFDSHFAYIENAYYDSFIIRLNEITKKLLELEEQRAEIDKWMEEQGIIETQQNIWQCIIEYTQKSQA